MNQRSSVEIQIYEQFTTQELLQIVSNSGTDISPLEHELSIRLQARSLSQSDLATHRRIDHLTRAARTITANSTPAMLNELDCRHWLELVLASADKSPDLKELERAMWQEAADRIVARAKEGGL